MPPLNTIFQSRQRRARSAWRSSNGANRPRVGPLFGQACVKTTQGGWRCWGPFLRSFFGQAKKEQKGSVRDNVSLEQPCFQIHSTESQITKRAPQNSAFDTSILWQAQYKLNSGIGLPAIGGQAASSGTGSFFERWVSLSNPRLHCRNR